MQPLLSPRFSAAFVHRQSLDEAFGPGQGETLWLARHEARKMIREAEKRTGLDAFVMGEGDGESRVVYQNRKTGNWERSELLVPVERKDFFWRVANTMYRLAGQGAYDKKTRAKYLTDVPAEQVVQIRERFPKQFRTESRFLYSD